MAFILFNDPETRNSDGQIEVTEWGDLQRYQQSLRERISAGFFADTHVKRSK